MTQKGAGPLASVRSPSWVFDSRRTVLHIGFFAFGTLGSGGRSSLGAELQNENVLSISLTIGSLSTRPRVSYVLLEKSLFEVFGPSQHGFGPSLLASLLSLPLFFWLEMRCFSPVPVSILALALFAVNPRLICYSAQLKPYTIDVLSTLLVWLSGYALRHHRYQWKWVAFFALVGCLLIWISSIVFVLCGVGLTLMFEECFAVGPVTPAASYLSRPYLGWLLFASNQLLIPVVHSLTNYYLAYWKDVDAFTL